MLMMNDLQLNKYAAYKRFMGKNLKKKSSIHIQIKGTFERER